MQRRIGIALSGGGYRAAAWGLGVLLYLADTRLNSSVETCSSVSGGSITNAAAALRSYRTMSPEEAWRFAARLAPRLSGNLPAFLGVLALHVIAWGAAIWMAAIHEPVAAAIPLGVAVIVSVLLARMCGDATFGSPVAWLYTDVLAASIAVLALAAGQGWWWLAGLALVGVVLLFRGVALGWAIGRSVLRTTKGERARLKDLAGDIDHVICACDLHGRHHVYFGRDFVYSYAHGLGTRPGLPLDAAVQSSANLPFAFPPRAMLAPPFRFTGHRHRSPLLALTDGGVYDNMADEWLLSFDKRTRRLAERAAEVGKSDPELGGIFAKAAARLGGRSPDLIVVANASGPLGSRFAWTTFLPIVGEFLSLLRVKSILYDNGNSTRRRLIVDAFVHGDLSGIIVHISTDPWSVVRDGLDSADPSVQTRAVATAHWLASMPGLDRPSDSPEGAATTLYPLGRGRIANLMQRAYVLASVQGHLWHDLPLPEAAPVGWFEALEAGRTADRPAPPVGAATALSALELGPPAESVPVWVDAVRDITRAEAAPGEEPEPWRTVRVTYFVVTSEVPEPSWLLELRERHGAAVLALGMVGVICGAGPRTTLFREPDQLGGMFDEIALAPNLAIDVEDLLVPAVWFGSSEPARGDVWRLDRSLFQDAYRFRSGERDLEELLEQSVAPGAFVFSSEETEAFRRWAQARIDDAKTIYPKDAELRLANVEAP